MLQLKMHDPQKLQTFRTRSRSESLPTEVILERDRGVAGSAWTAQPISAIARATLRVCGCFVLPRRQVSPIKVTV
jgi:hypothetical protein